MNLIQLSIFRPTAVISVVLMVILFGWVSLQKIPIQMAPDVRQPVIIIKTSWRGASPTEVEREIVSKQEEALKGIEGLKRILGEAKTNSGVVTLEFSPGLDFNRTLLLTANRLDRVTGYPEEADEPEISTSGTEDNAIAWFSLTRLDGNERPMSTYGDFLRDVIQERFERIPGIGGVNLFGETEREVQIIVDPEKLALYRITIPEMVRKLRAENTSVTGGDINEGKRRYVVRTEGELSTLNQIRGILIRSEAKGNIGPNLGRVKLSDVADVQVAYKERFGRARFRGRPALGMNVTREQGANVLQTMKEVRATALALADGPVLAAGLKMRQVYDETDYINSSIDLVIQNIYYGGGLAILILILFLRSWRPTIVIGAAIPVSVIGTFVAMAFLGRSLNVVSLAGIAFAVGMVVDAAIVVLENIFRLRQQGMSSSEAAYRGTSQVWPAVLVSSLTTVMVFIPILFMDLEAGQLFRDIGVAISVSVILSLLVSVTLIPALSNYIFKNEKFSTGEKLRLPVVDVFASAFVKFWVSFAKYVVQRKAQALGFVCLVTFGAGFFAWVALPKIDYLPTGNRNLVIGFVQPPSGYNLDTMSRIMTRVQEKTRKYWADVPSKAGKALEKVKGDVQKQIDRFFYVALRGRAFIAGTHIDDSKVSNLIPILQNPAREEPGTFAFVFQPSLWGRSIGSGRGINVDVMGPDLEQNYKIAQTVFFRLLSKFPPREGNRIRPKPGLSLGEPEIRITPNRLKLADNGVTSFELGQTIDALNDGLRIAEVTFEGKRLDLTLMGKGYEKETTQAIYQLPIVTQSGRIVPIEALSDIEVTNGPSQIRRINRFRTVTLQVSPKDNIPLEGAIDTIRDQVVAPMIERGLPDGVQIQISGSADKLQETWDEIIFDILLSIVIVYLVMAILFESFIYPLIVMLSVPVAAAGGLMGLSILNIFVDQSLDMLTMMGFIILIGIVVNNAILLVHQTLHHIREEGMLPGDAIEEATRNRVRPIFMSTLTSIFGMLPLVVFPGAGSELYRGLGSVVLGGLSLSAILTLALVPPIMSFTLGLIEKKRIS
ncbi:MAG: acriflavin resistance protein [Rhodospirillaceae bacterium]|nr:acriflavin resistance protein [Rhodospirillaceae bacterium]OUT80318.1 MAG: acriflavin resistance protein [Rhodospirillaceae bacterium TMED23]|tara:strand:+ start:24390 stop:27563 length:3174 start_codon:yes stop_codon:yes gene_type:complete